jgi:hypothetical protein
LLRRCPRLPLPKTPPSLRLLARSSWISTSFIDKFEHLSSPNLWNLISLYRSGGKGGAYDSIMAMQRYTTIEYIHTNVFPGQGKDKVYVFKMLVDRPGSGLDLVKRMQLGGVL